MRGNKSREGFDGSRNQNNGTTGQSDRIGTCGLPSIKPIAPFGMTEDREGAIWFTEMNSGRIGRLTTSGEMTEFELPNSDSFPSFIVPGPNGALWFTQNRGNSVGRIATEGDVTELPIPTLNCRTTRT